MGPLPMLLWCWLIAFAGGEGGLRDVGLSSSKARPVLLVLTPGLPETAMLGWVHTLESAGLDAWLWRAPARGQDLDAAVAQLRSAWSRLPQDRGQPALLAHGYGGVLALMADLQPSALALAGTPLAPQPVPVQVYSPDGPVTEAWPWDAALLGGLPVVPYSGALGRAYAAWTTQLPDLPVPQGPTLLLSSGLDPVAPPELVRLPSQDWPRRTWRRVGILALDPQEYTHAELLSDPGLAREIARFFRENTR